MGKPFEFAHLLKMLWSAVGLEQPGNAAAARLISGSIAELALPRRLDWKTRTAPLSTQSGSGRPTVVQRRQAARHFTSRCRAVYRSNNLSISVFGRAQPLPPVIRHCGRIIRCRRVTTSRSPHWPGRRSRLRTIARIVLRPSPTWGTAQRDSSWRAARSIRWHRDHRCRSGIGGERRSEALRAMHSVRSPGRHVRASPRQRASLSRRRKPETTGRQRSPLIATIVSSSAP